MEYNQAFANLINEGYEVKTKQYIKNGFELFKKYSGGFMAFYLIIFAVVALSTFRDLQYINSLFSILQVPLIAGVFIVANEIMRGNIPNFSTFFDGFKHFFQLLLLNIVSSIFIAIGFVLLLIPGMYLAVSYSFANLFVIFFGYDFWTAMELSRKIITKNWWEYFGFLVLIVLINFAGLLACGVGVLFTAPATTCMIYAAFEDIAGGAVRNANQQTQES